MPFFEIDDHAECKIITGYDPQSRLLPFWAAWQPTSAGGQHTEAVTGIGQSLDDALNSLFLQMAWSVQCHRDGRPEWRVGQPLPEWLRKRMPPNEIDKLFSHLPPTAQQ